MTAIDIQLPGTHGTSDDSTELFRFDFAADAARNAVLAGSASEIWRVAGPVELIEAGSFHGRRSADYLYVEARVPVSGDDLRVKARTLYDELQSIIASSGYSRPVRFWNVIPGINLGDGDQERYRQFCWGRAESLEGCDFALPAATGVGGHDDTLFVSLLAAKPNIAVTHFENPRQVSAYDYPRQYGPRSPSFARSTRISRGNQALLLLSGTASIVNHESRHIDDLAEQCAETRRNIDALLESVCVGNARVADATGSSVENGRLRASSIASRLYLRHPEQLTDAANAFNREFCVSNAPVVLHSDICREELLMEVEGVFRLESADTGD